MNTLGSWANLDLWQHADLLIREGVVVVDRPAGSAHPKVGEFVYPLDYGYLEGAMGGDGEGVDVWIGAAGAKKVTAVAYTIDPVRKNAELKLLWRCTPSEIVLVERFYASQPQAALVVQRPAA